MQRIIDDKDYIECLPSKIYLKQYEMWRARMLTAVDIIAEALGIAPVEEVMAEFDLTHRDVALLVRLKYFTEEEVEKFDLRRIEESVPE